MPGNGLQWFKLRGLFWSVSQPLQISWCHVAPCGLNGGAGGHLGPRHPGPLYALRPLLSHMPAATPNQSEQATGDNLAA